jgi:hypothetical protein
VESLECGPAAQLHRAITMSLDTLALAFGH